MAMQHGHGHHGHVPMVGSLPRGQFAKIVFPTAVGILLFIFYSILSHIFHLNLDTKELPTDAIIFCILWFLLFSSFLRGSFTSPGLVERGWYKKYPLMHKILKEKFEIYQKQTRQQNAWMNRFNRKQNNPTEEKKAEKLNDEAGNEETRLLIDDEEEEEDIFPDNFARPPRSHNCFELQANVLRMDHFCVWLNTAVGFYNYKYFILSIIYLFVSCLTALCILFYRLLISNYVKMEYGVFNVLCLLLTLIICLFFLAFSAMHSVQHLWQMSKNLTSIEYHKVKQLSEYAIRQQTLR